MSSITCFDLSPQVHTQQGAISFWLQILSFDGEGVWGAVRKNIISDRFSTKTATWSIFSYLYVEIAISAGI